jgi:hypothetical protein
VRRNAPVTGATRNTRAGTSAVGSQSVTSVIVIDDEGISEGPSSRATNSRGKRRREAQEQSATEVVDLIAEEAEDHQANPKSSAKRRRTARNSSSQPSNEGDVIVIEDD